ncbi:ATP-binding protein [Jannaschia sp. R86511]|uniref:ATP-binding protein n=1 Tax=Jannaschia sp. R86511 TaxID=3093853 RepID=UPI0036D21A93
MRDVAGWETMTGMTGREVSARPAAVLRLAPDPASVRLARDFVATTCTTAGTDIDVRDAAVLLTSEIVTNAFTHGLSEARLSVHAQPQQVRVEVADDNSQHPRTPEPDTAALDGRGIAIVEFVAARWGVRDDPYGKTVWFEVDANSY